MKTDAYQVVMPSEPFSHVQEAAKKTGLSVADTMRQSIELGLPILQEKGMAPALKPFTMAESREAFAPDPEWDSLEAVMARLPFRPDEE